MFINVKRSKLAHHATSQCADYYYHHFYSQSRIYDYSKILHVAAHHVN